MARSSDGSGPREPEVATTFTELMREIGDGDRASFAELYDRLGPRLHAVVRRRGFDDAQSERFLETCFLTLWTTAPRAARGAETPQAWVLAATDDAIRAVEHGSSIGPDTP